MAGIKRRGEAVGPLPGFVCGGVDVVVSWHAMNGRGDARAATADEEVEASWGAAETSVWFSHRPPAVASPGGHFAIRIRVGCPAHPELKNRHVDIVDDHGTVIRSLRLMFGMPDGFDSDMVALPVPVQAGIYHWRVVFPEQEDGEARLGASSADLTFEVPAAHVVTAQIWGIPGSVAPHCPVRATLGFRCSAGCNLSGRPFVVTDAAGEVVTSGVVSAQTAGSSGHLHVTPFEFDAPLSPGRYTYECVLDGDGTDLHGMAHTVFCLTVAHPGTCVVPIRATQEGVGGVPSALIRVGNRCVKTDAQGNATVEASAGVYNVVASNGSDVVVKRVVVETHGSKIDVQFKPSKDDRFDDRG